MSSFYVGHLLAGHGSDLNKGVYIQWGSVRENQLFISYQSKIASGLGIGAVSSSCLDTGTASCLVWCKPLCVLPSLWLNVHWLVLLCLEGPFSCVLPPPAFASFLSPLSQTWREKMFSILQLGKVFCFVWVTKSVNKQFYFFSSVYMELLPSLN